MRKRIVEKQATTASADSDSGWQDLAQIATVEVTSEDPGFPIESVFSGNGAGWRAANPGEQKIRVIFDQPVSVRRIQLRFEEPATERTQEFVLHWSGMQGRSGAEIVRQRWNFSPGGSTTEVEDYAVDLEGLSVLELAIRPDVGRPDAVASLSSFRVK